MFKKWIEETDAIEPRCLQNNENVSEREWLATLMLMVIPGVNLFMLFWWAFSSKERVSVSKVNWARGSLIVLLAMIIATAVGITLYLWLWRGKTQ